MIGRCAICGEVRGLFNKWNMCKPCRDTKPKRCYVCNCFLAEDERGRCEGCKGFISILKQCRERIARGSFAQRVNQHLALLFRRNRKEDMPPYLALCTITFTSRDYPRKSTKRNSRYIRDLEQILDLHTNCNPAPRVAHDKKNVINLIRGAHLRHKLNRQKREVA